MKPESEKTILDKLDEIGAPVHNILEGTESEYKGFNPIKMPLLKVSTKSPIKRSKLNQKEKAKKKAKRKNRKKSKRRG